MLQHLDLLLEFKTAIICVAYSVVTYAVQGFQDYPNCQQLNNTQQIQCSVYTSEFLCILISSDESSSDGLPGTAMVACDVTFSVGGHRMTQLLSVITAWASLHTCDPSGK